MKKLLLLFIVLLTGVSVGVKAQVVTDYSTAGSPVTFSTYVASAGTGARYAFMCQPVQPSTNGAVLTVLWEEPARLRLISCLLWRIARQQGSIG